VTNLAASVVLVVVPLRCEESGRMPKKFLEGFSKMASSVPRDSRRKPQYISQHLVTSVSEKHPIAQNASSFAYKR
jgi:hypothetical protein